MANEAAKAYPRLKGLLTGKGIDIGCGQWPITNDCDRWDVENGDAMFMVGAKKEHYDWVFSAHLLEHVKDPALAIANWWKLVKPGGVLIVLVPDEDLYEKGVWPSAHNGDHKVSFTLSKWASWSPVSVNLTDLLDVLPDHKLIDLTIQDTGYDYSTREGDQTAQGSVDDKPTAEAACQIIVLKNKPIAQVITRTGYNPFTAIYNYAPTK
jgi:SAM-dependent methyltransferase